MPRTAARTPTSRLSTSRIAAAARLIAPALRETPLRELPRLGSRLGCTLLAKDETTGPLGCFKGRGADAFVAARADRGRRDPLVCASAGNFGLALADAGRRHGIGVTVFVATNASAYKVARIASAGGAVVRHGADFDAAKDAARAFASARGLTFVEDGDAVEISEGAGTIAVELDGADEYDDLVVPVGNGALLAGMATWIRARRPHVRIVAVCSAHAPVMRDCWRDGARAARRRTATAHTIADGIAVRVPVPAAVADLAPLLDEFLAVDDDALRDSLRDAYGLEGLVLEPSAVAGIAAVAAHRARFAGRRVVTVLTGANLTDEQRTEYFAPLEAEA